MNEKIKKFGKTLDFWFVPSSFIRYEKDYEKEIQQKDNFFDNYIVPSMFELIRAGAYVGLCLEIYEKLS